MASRLPRTQLLAFITFASLTLHSPNAGANPPPTPEPFTLHRLGLASDSAPPFLRDTRLFLDGRLRYEYADTSDREDSDAFTWRHRLGIETGHWAGFSALAELEHTWDLAGEDHYNPFPRPGSAVISDPGNFELNRLQLSYNHDWLDTRITAGRQKISLADERWVGPVNWRQNQQTFDAVRLELAPAENLTLSYAYLWRVNRIFGEQAPSAVWNHYDSDTHLLDLRYTGLACGTLSAFAYAVALEEAANFSTSTYGLRFDGSTALHEPWSCTYDIQFALQSDYRNNPADYTALYTHLRAGLAHKNGFACTLAYELLGEDNGAALQTPLGTNHKFNGFADAFLVTPSSGLQDFYISAAGPLPWKLTGLAAYHYFLSHKDGETLGQEVDLELVRKLCPNASLLLKAAFLDGNGAQPDVARVSLQLDYLF